MSTTEIANDSASVEEYEVEEVEVSDNEDDSTSPTEGDQTTPTPPAHSNTGGGIVVPGGSVIGRMSPKSAAAPPVSARSTPPKPTAAAPRLSQTAAKINPDKNPFPVYGGWMKADVDLINIEFPILTGKNESTNELTRSNRPEARYWKAPISFKYDKWTSATMRFDNVAVPFHTGSGYGSNYMYICLPPHVSDAFSAAGKTRAPTRVTETSLAPDPNRWWKIVNNIEGKIGVVDKNTKKFYPKSLATIFDSSQSGITINAILRFTCKASTDEKEPLKPTTVRTVSVELERGYISTIDVNVQMPTRLNAKKAQIAPAASTKDVASDDLMERLKNIGM